MIPFVKVSDTEISVSQTGIRMALGLYRRQRNTEPTTLFINPEEFELAKEILTTFLDLPYLLIVSCPYYKKGTWSVGNCGPDLGFGSEVNL